MVFKPFPAIEHKCVKCSWSREIQSDAINLVTSCPKCGSQEMTIQKVKSRNLFEKLRKILS